MSAPGKRGRNNLKPNILRIYSSRYKLLVMLITSFLLQKENAQKREKTEKNTKS